MYPMEGGEGGERRVTNAANFSDTVSNCPISDGEEVKRKTFLTAATLGLARPPLLCSFSQCEGAKKKEENLLLFYGNVLRARVQFEEPEDCTNRPLTLANPHVCYFHPHSQVLLLIPIKILLLGLVNCL